MKSLLSKLRLTGAKWNVLTVVFLSLTGMVCLLYALIFLFPQVLPMQLQVPASTPTQTSPVASAADLTRPFPTFPAAWTEAYATRRAQAATLTPTPLGASVQNVSPTPSPAITVTANLPASVMPTLPVSLIPTATLASPIAPQATATATETATTPPASPDTPVPTASEEGYPPGFTGDFPTWTPLPPGYPSNP